MLHQCDARGHWHFNPLASERRDGKCGRIRGHCEDFNPLASERRDAPDTVAGSRNSVISIHSPLRGETRGLYRSEQRADISIHSPLRGETLNSSLYSSFDLDFNPLASERRDWMSAGSSIEPSQFQSTRL